MLSVDGDVLSGNLLLAYLLEREHGTIHDHVAAAVVNGGVGQVEGESVDSAILELNAFGQVDVSVRLSDGQQRTVGGDGAAAELTAPGLLVEELEVHIRGRQLDAGDEGNLMDSLLNLSERVSCSLGVP